mmetsp:Transcript_11650/g.29514  ORF Transcript_11650/g.29514 Transcript_11650/m.29514 type:complete len:112 (-) Transcript_11650:176-511(-)
MACVHKFDYVSFSLTSVMPTKSVAPIVRDLIEYNAFNRMISKAHASAQTQQLRQYDKDVHEAIATCSSAVASRLSAADSKMSVEQFKLSEKAKEHRAMCKVYMDALGSQGL